MLYSMYRNKTTSKCNVKCGIYIFESFNEKRSIHIIVCWVENQTFDLEIKIMLSNFSLENYLI